MLFKKQMGGKPLLVRQGGVWGVAGFLSPLPPSCPRKEAGGSKGNQLRKIAGAAFVG
jgi:hypothetical protein